MIKPCIVGIEVWPDYTHTLLEIAHFCNITVPQMLKTELPTKILEELESKFKTSGNFEFEFVGTTNLILRIADLDYELDTGLHQMKLTK